MFSESQIRRKIMINSDRFSNNLQLRLQILQYIYRFLPGQLVSDLVTIIYQILPINLLKNNKIDVKKLNSMCL